MQKIKTEQPYKLYKKILKNRSTAKYAVLGIAAIIFVFLGLVVFVIESVENGLDLEMLLALLFFMLVMPLIFYNPRLKAEYEPGVSYAYFRNYKKLTKKLPKALLYKEDQMRIENHQDVDFNVNVDLNTIYGVNDKLVMSYQNFDYEKQKMENGDYLLGVSAQGVYYVYKNQAVTKTKINFGDICTLGLLVCPGNIYVFHVSSKQNDEISIIIDYDDSLLVNPIMMFGTLLKLLDDYIVNGGVVSNSTSRKRRVSVSSGACAETGSTTTESQETSNKRVIDISYSTGVLEEMKAASYVGFNRKIDIDAPVPTEVANEESEGSKFVDNFEKNESVSNRSIDLDDMIESRIADVRKNIVIEDKANPVIIVPISQSQTEVPNAGCQKEETYEAATPKKKIHETEVLKEEVYESEIPKEKTQGLEMPKEMLPKEDEPNGKRNTGLIIGIVAGVLAIAAIVGFLVIKGMKGKDTIVQKEFVEENNNSDPCLTILDQLYNSYVLHDDSNFADVVDEWFTQKGKQKLIDAYDYECYDGDCYGIWALRTMAQDGDGESKIIDILQIGDGKYTVKYLDMGAMGETMVTFAKENGKMKIDDFRTIFDESYDENVGYLSFDIAGLYSNKNEDEFGCLFLYYDGSYMTIGYNWPEEKGRYIIQNNEVMFTPSAITNIEDDPTKWIEVRDRAIYVLPIDNANQKVGRYTKEDFLTEKEVAEAKAEYGDDWVFMVGGDGYCTRSTIEEFKQKSAFDDENASTPLQSVSLDCNQNQVVAIDGSELRLRLGPSTSSDTFKWPDGTNRHPNVGEKFKYLGESGDFYKIDFNGNELWVSKQFSHIE